MDEHSRSIKPKKRFSSFFGRFSGSKNLNSKRSKDADTEDKPSTMILKLKSPGAAGAKVEESNGQLLSDILTNEQLFDMMYGKSLVLQAEMTVEKRKDDGSPKTMTISGLVPVTLSRGERNGKPTRELRVRGHLRRKRSREIRLPYDDLALKSAGFGTGGRRREIHLERRPKPPEESKLLQSNSKVHERYRTMSTVSTKSKRDSVWPPTDVEGVDSGDEDPEPSRIENWSPLFDFSSPMSGPTGRDRVRALSDWKTPTPRFDLTPMKDESAEGRKDTANEKILRYNEPSQKPKDDFKIVDRTLVTGRTDSSDKDVYDKCSMNDQNQNDQDSESGRKNDEPIKSHVFKSCSNIILPENVPIHGGDEIINYIPTSLSKPRDHRHSETRDFGSQTSDPHRAKEVNRVHSSTQTDALRHRESSPEILIRTPKRTNLLSPEEIHDKLAKGFNESKQMISSVHEKASNKFAEVHEKIQNAITKRAGEKQYGYQESNHSPFHSLRYEPGNQNYTVDEQSVRKYDDLHHTGSNISHGSNSRGETTKDFAHNNTQVTSPPKDQDRSDRKHHSGKHIPAQEALNGKHEDLQNLHYSTERGYYYESPEVDPVRGNKKDNKGTEDSYEHFKKRLNMTRHGTAYPQAIEEARELVKLNSQKHDGDQLPSRIHGEKQPSSGSGSLDLTNNNGAPHMLRKDDIGSINEKQKSRTPPPNQKILEESKESEGKMKMNPIATITVSRSHTRLYHYSDGYTYTEKSGRQMVVIEAPKGMYFAS